MLLSNELALATVKSFFFGDLVGYWFKEKNPPGKKF
jgi:hypothetical protein